MSNLSHKILLLLAIGLDELVIWEKNLTSPYLRLKFDSYNNHYYEQTVSEMLKTGKIEKIIKNGEPYFKITSQGHVKLVREIPFSKRIGKIWDGRWRMVIFDIPENYKKKRDGLRRKLKDLGFAKWQESVYITPFDVASEMAEYLRTTELADYAVVLEAKKIFIGDEKEMANKLWHLDDLNFKYKELFEKYETKKDNGKLHEEYLDILGSDPYLPKELLPKPWWGTTVRELI